MTVSSRSLPQGKQRRAATALALILAAPLFIPNAQAADPAPQNNAALSDLDEVVVTGTRRSDRTVASSPVPIDVLPVDELEKTGLVQTTQMLRALVPSFNFPQPANTDGTDHVRPATLRGLSPDQTLVLVNGKRRHVSAVLNLNGSVGRGSDAVDLNTIPSIAIEKIEVLRDGAAAQYGSDAIAGVINIRLKGQDSGGSAAVEYGEYGAGDGQTGRVEANVGLPLPRNGYVTLSAEAHRSRPTDRSGDDPRQQYLTAGDPREATFDRHDSRFGDPLDKEYNLFLNASLPVNDKAEIYAFASLGQRDGQSAGFFRRAQDVRTVRTLTPDGYLPYITSKQLDLSTTVGVRGDLPDAWTYDLSVDYGRNRFDYGVENSVNVSLGTASPRDFHAGELVSDELVGNLDVRKLAHIGFLPDTLSIAVGTEVRREDYTIKAGEPASYINGGVPVLDGPSRGTAAAPGAQVFPGFEPADAGTNSRGSVGTYAELETKLTPDFLVNLAGRYEHYSDFGDTTNGELSAKYDLISALSVRGAISTGFRAPSLAQSHYSATSTVFINSVPYDVRTFPVTDPAAKALGAEPLKPEKSTNYSAGLVFRPTDNFYATVDFYQIDIDDRIVLSENLTGAAVVRLLAANGVTGIGGGRFFTNAVDTRTRGVDIVGRYAIDLGDVGSLSLTAGLNLNDTEVTRVEGNPSQLASLGSTVFRFGRSEKGRIEKGQPKNKLNLAATYDWDKLSTTVRTTRYGSTTSLDSSNPALDQTYGAKWITDIAISYQVTNAIGVTIGADNVFDVYPDKVIAANSTSGIYPYSNYSPFGFNGAFYYGRVSYKF
ncbi:TonB-dependent receptor plug domain-containing protein [Nitrospirillum amazonense]|uniref:TonB-dependent receptor plug domain-containing protein n=1 Tax=Nitrospirillum amazonense TaxID=28077 RepID=UPI002412C82C|nr:TonB-dependent receptor [Nitrospirillum amazonense]MDG3439986.1 TonB-dependent receptor [Nitrospirillum amazonense]